MVKELHAEGLEEVIKKEGRKKKKRRIFFFQAEDGIRDKGM